MLPEKLLERDSFVKVLKQRSRAITDKEPSRHSSGSPNRSPSKVPRGSQLTTTKNPLMSQDMMERMDTRRTSFQYKQDTFLGKF